MMVAPPARTKSTPQSMIPFAQDKHFVGREKILDNLDNAFSQQEHNRVALQGLGGIGYAANSESSLARLMVHA